MPDASFLLQLSFVVVGLVLAAGFVVVVGRVLGQPAMVWAGLVAASWLGLTAGLAWSGTLSFGPLPPRVLLVVTAGFVGTAAFCGSRPGRRLAMGLPLWLLVGYQAFRIAVELMLHRAHVEGLAPVQMTYLGRNFDVITGVTALILGAWLWRAEARVPTWVLWAWNLLGLGLLVNVVGTAMVSMPTPMRMFHNEPANDWVAAFPFVWLPTAMVVAALMGHILLFRRLGARPEPGQQAG